MEPTARGAGRRSARSSARPVGSIRLQKHPQPRLLTIGAGKGFRRPSSTKRLLRSSSRHVPTSITAYTRKCRSELCRNCVRSPRKHPQTPTFTGSHQEAFCGGKSLNRLRVEMFWYDSIRLAGIVFQASAFNHSAISPFRINHLR
jgi:hypothetical protein